MSKKHPPQQLHTFSDASDRVHTPVLLRRVLEFLAPKVGESYLDLTAGYGGHAQAIIERTERVDRATLVDRDAAAIAALQPFVAQGATVLHTDFLSAAEQLSAAGKRFDMVLVDLGVSSPQLDRQERGFSFTKRGPLDMRMDQRSIETAADIVNTYSQESLTQIIREYGEEPHSRARAYARAIVAARPLKTTDELADVIVKAHRGGYKKTHPATRTFQALRIALNRELEQIEQLLPLLPEILTPGGRVGVISFHSLEDRRVKQFFAEQANAGYEAELTLLTKKPITGATDDVHNPRARSAKLRVAVKK